MQENKDTGRRLVPVMTAVIVSADAIFSRMLSLEIGERGIKVSTSQSLHEAICQKPNFIFADAVLFDPSEKLNDGCELFIFGKREHIAAQSDVIYDYPVYERPFVVKEMLDAAVGRPVFGEEAPKRKKSASDGLRLHSTSHSATYKGEHISLSKKEFALLQLLMEKKGTAVSRNDAAKIFGENGGKETNVVDVYIKYLREKIDERFDIKLICAVRGVGYIIN